MVIVFIFKSNIVGQIHSMCDMVARQRKAKQQDGRRHVVPMAGREEGIGDSNKWVGETTSRTLCWKNMMALNYPKLVEGTDEHYERI